MRARPGPAPSRRRPLRPLPLGRSKSRAASLCRVLGPKSKAPGGPGPQQETPVLHLQSTCVRPTHPPLSMSLPLPPRDRRPPRPAAPSGWAVSSGQRSPELAGLEEACLAWGQPARSCQGRARETHFIGSQERESEIGSGRSQDPGTGMEEQGAGPGRAVVSLSSAVKGGPSGQLPGAPLGEGVERGPELLGSALDSWQGLRARVAAAGLRPVSGCRGLRGRAGGWPIMHFTSGPARSCRRTRRTSPSRPA